MIVIIQQSNAHKYSNLMDRMFRLRARVFHDRLGWDVHVADGRERDRYDENGPVYLICTDEDHREVKGSLRLLPTTGPTLLADVFWDTVPDAVRLSAPTIWECTRFCFDDGVLAREQLDSLRTISAELLAGLSQVAAIAGIETIVGNFDSQMLRLCCRIGFEVEVLGSTSRYGRPVYLGLLPISGSALGAIAGRLRAPSILAKAMNIAA